MFYLLIHWGICTLAKCFLTAIWYAEEEDEEEEVEEEGAE